VNGLADNEKDVRDGAAADTLPSIYDAMLARWETYARRGIREGNPWHFGDPGSGENGIRSMANFVFTSGFVATRQKSATSLEWARRGIDYLTRGHKSGNAACADGQRWGIAWQSSWWTAKLAFGAKLVWNELSDEQRERVRTVVAAEASHLLSHVPPTGMCWDTKAEENAWDTEILAAASALTLPDDPLAARWIEQLHMFAVNALSRAVDRDDARLVSGKPLRDRISSCNVFHDYTIENHGSCHFCYVASPLDSLTWARAAFMLAGRDAPESLSHNVKPFWEKHKSLFLDERFAYAGGQDWSRYTYGEYFIVPVCVAMQQQFADPDAAAIELARAKRLHREQSRNGETGAFFGSRVTRGTFHGQPAKYETDCYAHIALARLLHELNAPGIEPRSIERVHEINSTAHVGLETQVAWVRTPKMFASFCPLTLDQYKPIVLIAARDADHLLEFMPGNLCGCVDFAGAGEHCPRVVSMRRSGERIVTINAEMLWQTGHAHAVSQKLTVTLDGDAGCVRVYTLMTALKKLWIKQCHGLNLAVANDAENNALTQGPRRYNGQPLEPWSGNRGKIDKAFKRLGLSAGFRQAHVDLNTRELSIDDTLKVTLLTPDQTLWVRQSPEQNAAESMRYDVIGCGPRRSNFFARPGEVLVQFEAEVTTL
jgi:hypothetical protein